MNKLTHGLAIAIASVSMLLSGSALAQDFSGHWGCQYGYAEDTAQGYLRGHTREFNLALYANGGFEAAGLGARASSKPAGKCRSFLAA